MSVKNAPKAKPLSKSERRYQEILQRATECFDRRGYANTTLDDIAGAVGVKREALYYYFQNRAQILLAIIEPQSVALIEELKEIVEDSSLSQREKFKAAIRTHLERFDKYCLEMTVSMRTSSIEYEPEVRDTMARIWSEYETMWVKLISEGQSNGNFRKIGDPKMLAFGILGMCNWLARWYNPRRAVTIGELIESYTEILSQGIYTPELPPEIPAAKTKPTSSRKKK